MPRARAQEPGPKTFEAKYHGLCLTGDRIVPGDVVLYADDQGYTGVLVHEECLGLPVAAVMGQPTKACPICNLTSCDHELSEKAAWEEMG